MTIFGRGKDVKVYSDHAAMLVRLSMGYQPHEPTKYLMSGLALARNHMLTHELSEAGLVEMVGDGTPKVKGLTDDGLFILDQINIFGLCGRIDPDGEPSFRWGRQFELLKEPAAPILFCDRTSMGTVWEGRVDHMLGLMWLGGDPFRVGTIGEDFEYPEGWFRSDAHARLASDDAPAYKEHDPNWLYLLPKLLRIHRIGTFKPAEWIRFEHGQVTADTPMESPRGHKCLARDVKAGQEAWDPNADIPGGYLHYGKRLS
jgi:hypothetical protein